MRIAVYIKRMSKYYIIILFKSYMYRAIQRLFGTEGLQPDHAIVRERRECW